jgi:capsular polysaccharide biosynthesis protein
MISWPSYKVGDTLFRSLANIQLAGRYVRGRLCYSDPVPTGLVPARQSGGRYTCMAKETVLKPRGSEEIPTRWRPFFEARRLVEQPEQFLLELEGARIFDAGCVITADNRLIEETSPDFHRHPESHWLFYAGRLPRPERVAGTVAVLASAGTANYFHWTLGAVPRFSLLAEYVDEVDYFYVDRDQPFQVEWLTWLGVPMKKVLDARPGRHILADRVLLPSFAGSADVPSQAGLSFLRSFVPRSDDEPKRRLFISRRSARRRRLSGEARLQERLVERGVEIVYPGAMSVVEQMRLFSAARNVLAVHGAELTNLVFCAPGTQVVELFPARYVNPCYRNLAQAVGLSYRCVITDGGERESDLQDRHHVWANVRMRTDTIDEVLGGE